MRLLKKINNNFALALDSAGKEIIVEGRGIGFQKMPCEWKDLSKVTRTYYSIGKQDIALLQSVSEDVLNVAAEISDEAMKRIGNLNPKLTFTLADHIAFVLERYEKGMQLNYPIYYDINRLYPLESEIASHGVKLISDQLHVSLPQSEKTGIALNIISNESEAAEEGKVRQKVIDLCTSIVETMMHIHVDRDSFNYSRFVSHLNYIIQKQKNTYSSASENAALYHSVSEQYPSVSRCVDRMAEELERYGYHLNEEEKLYLILHVNRLCGREDCHQK